VTAAPFGIPAGPIESEPRGFRPDDEQEAILRDALQAAGVELGAYDDRIVRWLAGWEWSTVAVVASWINRAAGKKAPKGSAPGAG
jgi:hypothetical protein